MKKLFSSILLLALPMLGSAFPTGKIAFRVLILDEATGAAMRGVQVEGIFTDIPALWGGAGSERVTTEESDKDGICRFTGTSNHGTAYYKVVNPSGYYAPPPVKYFATNQKRDFLPYRCEPYDCVFTTVLQRVEQPTPLFVRNVGDHINRSKVGHWNGTNMVFRYDLVKGDCLPPDGHGEVADLVVDSRVSHQETTNVCQITIPFFDFTNVFFFPGEGNGLVSAITAPDAGIKLRTAPDVGYENRLVIKCGMRKLISGAAVFPKRYSESDPNRCHYFRIRSKFDEKGNLVAAYYGKIYSDFKIGHSLDSGCSIEFLYYLNPTSLDRNLEWDMKTNLCTNPGRLPIVSP